MEVNAKSIPDYLSESDSVFYADIYGNCFTPFLIMSQYSNRVIAKVYAGKKVSATLCMLGKGSVVSGLPEINPLNGLCSTAYVYTASGEEITVLWPTEPSACKERSQEKPGGLESREKSSGYLI